VYSVSFLTAPEAPVNLQVTKQTPRTISLTWEHPNVTNGILRVFVIRANLLSSWLQRQARNMMALEKVLPAEKCNSNCSYEVSESSCLHFL
jgi:hypothetical protein